MEETMVIFIEEDTLTKEEIEEMTDGYQDESI